MKPSGARNASIFLSGIFVFLAAGCSDNQETTTEIPETVRAETPIDKAVFSIPPKERAAFNEALKCEIKRNKGDAIDITPDFIKDLYLRLKSNPELKTC